MIPRKNIQRLLKTEDVGEFQDYWRFAYKNLCYLALVKLFNNSNSNKNIRKRAKNVAKNRKEFKEKDFPISPFYTYKARTYKDLILLHSKSKNAATRAGIKNAAKNRNEFKEKDFKDDQRFIYKKLCYFKLVKLYKKTGDKAIRGGIKRQAMRREEFKEKDFPQSAYFKYKNTSKSISYIKLVEKYNKCFDGKKRVELKKIAKNKKEFKIEDFNTTLKPGHKNLNFRPFKEARAYVRNLRLRSSREWISYCKSGKKPTDIPTNPREIYKDWISWYDWLGTQKETI